MAGSPYDSGFGSVGIIGREDAWDTAKRAFERYAPSRECYPILFRGSSGSGRTFFLDECSRFGVELGVVPVRVEFRAGEDNILAFLNAVMAAGAWLHPEAPKTFVELANKWYYPGVSLFVGRKVTPEVLHFDNSAFVYGRGVSKYRIVDGILWAMVHTVRAFGYKGMAVLVDNAHFATTEELRIIGSATQPISGCSGLPQAEVISIWAGDVGFVRQVFDHTSVAHWFDVRRLGCFSFAQTGEALNASAGEFGVSWSDEAVELVCALMGGVPGLVRVMAKRVWDPLAPADGYQIGASDVMEVLPDFMYELSETLFWPCWEGCTEAERNYLLAVSRLSADQGSVNYFEVAKALGIDRVQADELELSLVYKGILLRDLDEKMIWFVVPAFSEYIRAVFDNQVGSVG